MTEELKKHLDIVTSILNEANMYYHASNVLSFDQETICPPKAMEEQGEVSAFLGNQGFKLVKSESFERSSLYLYEHRDELEHPYDVALAESLHRDYSWNKNITPDMNEEFSLIFNRSYINWINAKQSDDFSVFASSLKEVRDVELKKIELKEDALPNAYDNLLDIYERGITEKDLDDCFSKCKERLVPLLKKIMASNKKIRVDFMNRTVTDEQQKKLAQYLLGVMGFDFERGAFTVTEHPFTSGIARNDIRVTTHYYPDMFYSSMYSIIHEGGHALFEMYQPEDSYCHNINSQMTMGMHESVSRFYENRIGRSKEFIHLIYPKLIEIMPEFSDVTERELYEAMNTVQPSLIRTEADEFTYTFHVIIRYEIEKMIIRGDAKIEDLPKIWNDKYEEYLGIRPESDKEGILQDVHWSSGFGYFPAYALGNMYNAMYFNKIRQDIDFDDCVSSGKFDVINAWMAEHVFKKANIQDSKTWIKEITGRDFTTDDFLDYLEKKYSEIYDL